MSAPKRAAVYGPEPWLTDGDAVWSHWDLWFCQVACLDHGGDLADLADAIAESGRPYGGSDAERKLSHLDDLAARLRAAGLDSAAVAASADGRPALRAKARKKALVTYARLPHVQKGIAAEDWCKDLCELLAWEQHGLLLDRETVVFEHIHGDLADLAERFLRTLSEELRSQRLDHEADEALQAIAYMHSAHARLTRFASIAKTLGSDHWRPIVTMARTALARGRTDVARATFIAADRPGMHQRYLSERCAELTGSPPPSAPQSARL